MKKKTKSPGLLWITGLSGSGKTTISKIIYNNLKKKYTNIILFDGDILRKKLKIKNLKTFSNDYRTKIGLKYVSICNNKIKNNRKFVIIAAMALIKKVENKYKKIKNCNDVFIDVPIKELIRRDPKGLYKKFKKKQIFNMAGLDLDYHKPKNAKLVIKWKKKMTAYSISKQILKLIE